MHNVDIRSSADEVPLRQFFQVLGLNFQKLISFRQYFHKFSLGLVYPYPAPHSFIDNQFKHHALCFSGIELQSSRNVLEGDGAVGLEHDGQFFLLHVEQQLLANCQVFFTFWAEVEIAVVALELFDIVSFVSIDKGDQFVDFFFVFEGDWGIVVKRVVPAVLP